MFSSFGFLLAFSFENAVCCVVNCKPTARGWWRSQNGTKVYLHLYLAHLFRSCDFNVASALASVEALQQLPNRSGGIVSQQSENK